jgi:hypothetical protein
MTYAENREPGDIDDDAKTVDVSTSELSGISKWWAKVKNWWNVK